MGIQHGGASAAHIQLERLGERGIWDRVARICFISHCLGSAVLFEVAQFRHVRCGDADSCVVDHGEGVCVTGSLSSEMDFSLPACLKTFCDGVLNVQSDRFISFAYLKFELNRGPLC